MKGERLKFPIIVSQLEELRLDLEEWRPQLERRAGLGDWTFGDVRKIVRLHLKNSDFLLEQIKRDGIKPRKGEAKQLRDLERFFEEIKSI
jgi:hypothetical protein